MKTFLHVFLFLCFVVGIVAVAQPPNQAPQTHESTGQSTSIMGTVSEQGEILRLVTAERIWRVDNPGILKGHEGQYVRVNAHVYSDKGSIHITEVKMPTGRESRENDQRSHRLVSPAPR